MSEIDKPSCMRPPRPVLMEIEIFAGFDVVAEFVSRGLLYGHDFDILFLRGAIRTLSNFEGAPRTFLASTSSADSVAYR